MGTEIMKIFILIILFCGKKNSCLGLYTLLLLKIIFSMKGIIFTFGGWGKMCGYLYVHFFKVAKMWKVYKWKKVKQGSQVCLIHTINVHTHLQKSHKKS